jgi:hypothetical protein
MRTIAGLLLAMALTTTAGCVRTDWIDRTLVTVDVTGTWYGRRVGEYWFELEQQGSTVKGSLKFTTGSGWQSGGALSGPIKGSVAGDLFRFSAARGSLDGELTVSGDEMNGRISSAQWGTRPFSLRRIDPSSRPDSPPQ